MATGDHSDQPMPCAPAERTACYDRYGPEIPVHSPIIISVPHAGREYSPELLANARIAGSLRRLEDRYADLLAYRLIREGYCVVIARAPRAMIDLNRDEREVDPAMVEGIDSHRHFLSSAKLRGGLGLVPRRLQGIGELWQHRIAWTELSGRIERLHRPYHAELARLMDRAHAIHGQAILLDLHSMPPLPPQGKQTPRIVLGDRFGRSAAPRLTALAADICAGRGLATAQNHPYAGNYLIERHGRPDRQRHALQIEIDRGLYLDSAHQHPGPGLAAIQALVADLALALGTELPGVAISQAAE